MAQDEDNQPKVVNLADARKRQKTVRVDAGGRRVGASKGMNGSGKPAPGGGKKIWQYVQFILFLAVVAIMMQLCSRGL